MSRWTSTFETQQLGQKVQACLTLLESTNIAALAPDDLAEYARLLKVAKVLQGRFSTFDPELCHLGMLGNYASWLTNAQNQIAAFAQNRNIGHLHNANSALDDILNSFRPPEMGLRPEDMTAVAAANASFSNKIVEELQSVAKKGLEVKSQLDGLSKQIEVGKTRLAENDQNIQSQKTRLDQITSEFQKQFSEAQGKRVTDFGDILKRNQDDFTAKIKTFEVAFKESASQQKKEYEAFFDQTRKTSNTHLEFLQKREDDVNKIFGTIGSTAFAGNFKTTADNESSAANLWRWIALVFMAAMIVVGGFAFWYSMGHETEWKVFAFRLGTVVVLAIPAIYAATESSKHRERERLNRKIHLELASIDAYLVLLPEEQRHKIKGSLTEKFFGVPVVGERVDEVSQKDMFGVLTSVVTNLTKAK